MKPFLFPVVLNETSLGINLLHKALKTVGFPVPEEEEKLHTAGTGTLKQVRAFQAKLKIKFDEKLVVDEATVMALQELLLKNGMLLKANSFTVKGNVNSGKGEPVKFQELIALDVDLRGAAVYRTVKSIKEILANGGLEFLGTTKSDHTGNYLIEFYSFQFAASERKKADVVVYAINNQGEILGRSRMVNSEEYSGQGEVRNFDVLITKNDKRTEYEIVMNKLLPFLKESKVSLIDLAKSNDQVKFTAGELDEQESKIQIAVNAESLRLGATENNNKPTNSVKLSHELLYGIGRQNISLSWLVLYKRTDKELRTAIEKSVKKNIIKKYDEKEITAFLKLIHECAAAYILTYKGNNQAASLEKLLSAALPKKIQQQAFVNAYRNFKSQVAANEIINYKKFWREYLPAVKEFAGKPELITSLLFTQQLFLISGNHQPLMEALQVTGKYSSVNQLIALGATEWKEIIKKSGVPEFIKGENEVERIAAYANQMQTFLNAAYPTQKIAVMMKNKELPIENVNVSEKITAFISQNPGFDIGTNPIHEYVDEIKSIAKEYYPEVKKELNRMQRVFQVSPRPEVMGILMEKNLNSAYTIASIPKKSFIKMYAEALGGNLMAETVYQRAEHVSTLAAERAIKMYDLSHLDAPAFAYSKSDREEVLTILQNQVSKRHNPNYVEIFGSPDMCECDQCRSVNSASAYFVDLLRFLWRGDKNDDRSPAIIEGRTVNFPDGRSPLDKFTERRPDLLHLPLTCENTNTIIPYIDLVNEVMEFYTCNSMLSSDAAYNTGSTTAEELRTNPQNFELRAYSILKDAVYPFSLPYHQPLDVIRTYSDHLRTERYEVMKAMQKKLTAEHEIATAAKVIEAEALRISEEEYIILAKKKFDGSSDTKLLHQYFGYANATDLEKLAGNPLPVTPAMRVPGVKYGIHEFLSRSGITYLELVELLKTKFINPHQDILEYLEDLFMKSGLNASTIYSKLKQIKAGTLNPSADTGLMTVLEAASISAADFANWVGLHFDEFDAVITLYQSESLCNIDSTFLRTIKNVYAGTASSGILADTWSKIHRFIRLWRKLGWTMHEVDVMLAALGENDITDVTITKLSYVVLLNKQLKLPINKLATLWGSIDTYGDKSLYKILFLNKAVQRIDHSFEADNSGNYLTGSAILQDHIPAILAAFRISEDDLNAIIGVATVTTRTVAEVQAVELTIPNLSAIYRFVIFSKALKLKVPDFCLLAKLFNTPADLVFENPTATYNFYELAASVKKSGFKAELLQYIFAGTLPADSTIGLSNEKVFQATIHIKKAFETIAQRYPTTPLNTLTADIVRSNLLSLPVSTEDMANRLNVVNALIGITGTRQTFSIITDTGLAISILPPLSTKYNYNTDSGELKSAGIMSEADRTALKVLENTNETFDRAVDALYIQTKTLSTGSPSYSLFTDRDLDVIIPDSLSPKFTYTKASGRLACIGVMSDSEKIELKALHGASPDFQTAVDRIYDMPEVFIRENFSDVFAAANSALLSADFITLLNHPAQAKEKTSAEKLQFIYDNSLPLLKQKLHEEVILKHIALLTGLSEEVTLDLIKDELETIFGSVAGDGFSIEEFAKRYHRASKFTSGFALTDKEVKHFVSYKSDFDNIDFKAITSLHWKRIHDYVQLRNIVPQAQALLTDVFAAANITPLPVITTTLLEELTTRLHLATSWDLNTIKYLIKATYFNLQVRDFKNEVALIKIYTAVSFVIKTGLPAETLAEWADTATGFDHLNATADLVRRAVKAKYETEDWLKLAGNLSDKIRENQKQALISYLLTKEELIAKGITDADGLFEYFLIDVQMGACMDTSRIVQANAAVQLFVNRCLLNLESEKVTESGRVIEKGVAPEAIDKDRWLSMKNYRVWEANRKIFLYPENWLEPEWRDDRSPFFKELESELTQNDITDRSVETAFRNYLTKLNTVANPDVCGMYQENYDDGKLKLLHVFGRTHNAPYQFFYRTCNNSFKWSSWEKVQVDIRMTEDGVNSGVHLTPVVWKNRLFIFWAEFIEKPVVSTENDSRTVEQIARESTAGSLNSHSILEARLAWSENIEGKWSPKQLSKDFLSNPNDFNDPIDIRKIILKSSIAEDGFLYIMPYAHLYNPDNGFAWWYNINSFKLSDIQSQVVVLLTNETYYRVAENGGLHYNNNYEKHNSDSQLAFWDNTYLQNSINHNIIFSNNILEKEVAPGDPFFYQALNRTYFVRPVDVRTWDVVISPEDYFPTVFFNMENPSVMTRFPDSLLNRSGFVMTGNSTGSKTPPGKTTSTMFDGNKIGGDALMANGKIKFENPALLYDTSGFGRSFSGVLLTFEKNYNETIPFKKGFEFHTFHHPYSSQFVTNLNKGGIKALMDSDTNPGYNDNDSNPTHFEIDYNPNFESGLVKQAPFSNDYKAGEAYTYYKENICFDVYGANSIYNWELFFHAPLYIATRLSKNGKFEEAMSWFHYIFDPTTDEMPVADSETSRYWKVLPFKKTAAKNLEDWFKSLGANNNSDAENPIIAEWRDNPFSPFTVARNRPLAFMKNVVIKYVENLRAWGDSLFRSFSRESVNEALQLYVIANHILGPRPEFIPKRGVIKAETYESLKVKLDDFGNALIEMENIFPYSSTVPVSTASTSPSLLGMGPALYFCIPGNEKLLEHWDTIADRLFKIRHCMDIDGVERQLALFSPPIDPAMLINAAAQGISIGSILSDISSPPPIYRFTYLMQKANEFCGEVKSLGSSLLSTMEKKDSEELGRLRASHETAMLDLMTAIKERQVYDAKLNKAGLLKSRETAMFRLEHYNSLLSDDVITIPPILPIDAELNDESQLPADTSIPIIATDVDEALVGSDERGVKLIGREKNELDLNRSITGNQAAAMAADITASYLGLIPQFGAHGTPLGVGASTGFGGRELSWFASSIGKMFSTQASISSVMASQSGRMAGYIRREQDWTLQANLAAKEIIQLDKQITSADIKIQISQKELLNHKQQIENSKQVEQYLKDKFTNQELYQWMKEQLFSVYKQSYNMAYDMAKKVEKCYRYELGNEVTGFIQYGYWDNNMQGLCAGEKLQLALRQLETSYLEENKRELELTKSVSTAMLNPLTLQELRTTGKCFLTIPEELYDLDYQGHYFRRIKSVSLSLPCIAGPYTTVNCTLRLLKNVVRINTSLDPEYQHINDEGVWLEDGRFRESNVPVKAIATSTGQRDSGMFELSFRDERYLPFEGAGAISEWKIELTQDAELRQFDYSTISDVILHINYTAREDAGPFKNAAVTYLKNFLTNEAELSTQPLLRMFSMKHEFSTEWHKFLNPVVAGSDQILSVTLQKEHFPFFTKDRAIIIKKIEVLMKANRPGEYKMILSAEMAGAPINSLEIGMPESLAYTNMQTATLTKIPIPSTVTPPATPHPIPVEEINVFSPISLKFKHNSDTDFHSINRNPEEISDLFVAFHYYLGNGV